MRGYYGRFSSSYYPPEILQLVPATCKAKPKSMIALSDQYQLSGEIEHPLWLPLASHKLNILSGRIEWETHFTDPEDVVSLHRWNWLLYNASDESCKSATLKWMLAMQEDWVEHFQEEIQLPSQKLDYMLRWESYTVGERISNSVLLYTLKNIVPSQRIQKAIINQVQFLTTRMEYFGDMTGNHILNNARAIYLAGCYFQCEPWRIFAETIFRRELPILINSDGFLREGSSHYQFLFTRWILEILFFIKAVDDDQLMNFLIPYAQNLMKQCSFFVDNLKSNSTFIPLFGDISPDFPPNWFKYITNNNIIDSKTDSIPEHSWNYLWRDTTSPYSLLDLPNSNLYHNNGVYNFSQTGWYRINHKKYTVIMHTDPDGIPAHVGHYHNDAGHFCLYHDGTPLLIDSGRLDYLDLFGVSSKAHNIITLNDLGLIPENSNRYPRTYSTCNNYITSDNNNGDMQIIFESDGFNRIADGIVWKRYLNMKLNKFSIQDSLSGRGEYVMKAYFHFDSEIQLKEKQKNEYLMQLQGLEGSFLIEFQGEFHINTYCGDNSNLGWQCLAYGKRVPAYTLEIVKQVHLPAIMNYSLIWI